MPFVLLFLGLGSLFAWGVVRAKKEEDSVRDEEQKKGLPSAATSPFPWDVTSPSPSDAPLPSVFVSPHDTKFVTNNYDDGLTEKELVAIVYARQKDSDPARLEQFANTLAPQFPIAVLRLRERAKQIRRAPWRLAIKQMELSPKLSAKALSALSGSRHRTLAGADDDLKWSTFFTLPAMAIPPRPVLEAEIAAAKPVENIDFRPGDSDAWERARREIGQLTYDRKLAEWERAYGSIQDVYETLIPVSRFTWGLGGPASDGSVPTFQMKLADALSEVYYDKEAQKNKDLEKKSFFASLVGLIGDAVHAVAAVYTASLKYIAAPVLSYIPGIGTAAAALATASAEIAMGERVDRALVDGAAMSLPGQPMSGWAFKAGIAAIEAAARGERFDAVALSALRDAAIAALPADVRKLGQAANDLVDTGIAMAQAKDLQEAGFQIWHKLARGNSPVEQAADFYDKMDKSAKTNVPVEVLLKNQIQSDLAALNQDVRDQVLALMSEMSRDPSLMHKTPNELASEKDVPEPVARAALATVKILPIPKWMANKLGLGDVLYVDASLARDLVREPSYLKYTGMKLDINRGGASLAKLTDRDQLVRYYLKELEAEKKPYLTPSGLRSLTAPKGLGL